MDNKKSRGGKRAGSGRKPLADKKYQLSLYIEKSKIDKHGGIYQIKTVLYNFINEDSNANNNKH